jgi:hypothetical protein
MSQSFHLILKGKVNIMDRSGVHEYGVLLQGGCFGDISLLLNKVNEYSYFYDNHTAEAIQLLTIDAEKFLELTEKFPLAKSIFT